MNIITHLKNCIFLFKYSYKKQIPEKADAESILKVTKHFYTRKNSWVRNQVSILIRNIREAKPYQVIDYSKAKELYDNTVPIDLSKVKVGSYIVKYSEDCPVKGERWCEYYINFSSGTGMFKVVSLDKYIDFVDYRGESSYRSLNGETSRSFRFATKEEIEEFKIARKNYKQKKKEIDKLQKQISKLYKEL